MFSFNYFDPINIAFLIVQLYKMQFLCYQLSNLLSPIWKIFCLWI